MANPYPERTPAVGGFETFTASFAVAAEQKRFLEEHLNRLEAEIEELVNGTTVGGGPVLMPLLHLSQDRAELEQLSRALARVAPLVEARARLNQRLAVFEVAEADPEWLVSAFGDFDEQLASLGEVTDTGFVPAPAPGRRRNRLEL